MYTFVVNSSFISGSDTTNKFKHSFIICLMFEVLMIKYTRSRALRLIDMSASFIHSNIVFLCFCTDCRSVLATVCNVLKAIYL